MYTMYSFFTKMQIYIYKLTNPSSSHLSDLISLLAKLLLASMFDVELLLLEEFGELAFVVL